MLLTEEPTLDRTGKLQAFFSFKYTENQNLIHTILFRRWLTYWSSHGGENQVMFLQIYALVNAIAILTMLSRVLLVLLSGLNAAKLLFAELLDAILRAPMSFFDSKFKFHVYS